MTRATELAGKTGFSFSDDGADGAGSSCCAGISVLAMACSIAGDRATRGWIARTGEGFERERGGAAADSLRAGSGSAFGLGIDGGASSTRRISITACSGAGVFADGRDNRLTTCASRIIHAAIAISIAALNL